MDKKHFVSVRSYLNPRVDILLNGKIIKQFKGSDYVELKAKAINFCQKNRLNYQVS